MSSGATSQIYSNEDVVFFLNPQITYFKSVYRKHTKFSINESEELSDGNDFFNTNTNEIIINIGIKGDLLSEISMKMVVDDTTGIDVSITNFIPYNIGSHLIDVINFKIENREVESLDHIYLDIMGMLNNEKPMKANYDIISEKLECLNGNNYQRNTLSGGIPKYTTDNNLKKLTSITPLPFSFTRSTGTALPIFMLSNRNTPKIEIKKKQTLSPTLSGLVSGNLEKFKFSLICKYITLSEEEKYRFQSSDQEYLLEKLKLPSHHNISIGQEGSLISLKNRVPNLPIKSIFIYNNSDINTSEDTKLIYSKMNYEFFIRGVNLYSEPIPHEYFSKVNLLENFKYCDGIHNVENDTSGINNNIAYINFSLKETEGPSGSINTGLNDLTFKCSFNPSTPKTLPTGTATDGDNVKLELYIVYYCLIRFKTDGTFMYPYGG